MAKKTIRDIDIRGKRVLMRVDFNVPLDDRLNITDDSRIRAALPTINYALQNNAKVILMSHLGRPKGKPEPKYSLKPVAVRLSKLLRKDVKMLGDCVGDAVKQAVNGMREKDVALLENLRFHKEEEANDANFSAQLASLGDVFVNDAFGTCHRAHASTVGVTKYLPAVSGFLVEKEITYFDRAIRNPEKPVCLILGGAKVSDKIGVIDNMLDKIDYLLIGGAMAYTFMRSRIFKGVGNSKVEEDKIGLAGEIFRKAAEKKVSILLPDDHVIAQSIDKKAKAKIAKVYVPDGWIGLDIGPATVRKFCDILKGCKTIIWNGTLGYFELPQFRNGTRKVAKFITRLKATSIIGGGDTAAAIYELGLGKRMSHISTGGGASLEYLEGKTLPGVAALQDK